MKHLKILLKILNPFIWLINVFMYLAHSEGQRYIENYDQYEPYDFLRDIEYF